MPELISLTAIPALRAGPARAHHRCGGSLFARNLRRWVKVHRLWYYSLRHGRRSTPGSGTARSGRGVRYTPALCPRTTNVLKQAPADRTNKSPSQKPLASPRFKSVLSPRPLNWRGDAAEYRGGLEGGDKNSES